MRPRPTLTRKYPSTGPSERAKAASQWCGSVVRVDVSAVLAQVNGGHVGRMCCTVAAVAIFRTERLTLCKQDVSFYLVGYGLWIMCIGPGCSLTYSSSNNIILSPLPGAGADGNCCNVQLSARIFVRVHVSTPNLYLTDFSSTDLMSKMPICNHRILHGVVLHGAEAVTRSLKR